MDKYLLLQEMIDAALEAEKGILAVYQKDFGVEIKEDHSPVTEADKNADALIRKILQAEHPDFAFLTEESKDDLSRLEKEHLIIVDPVDGTSDFVSRSGEFTTNIAYVYKHETILGVINWCLGDWIYYAIKGEGAFKKNKRTGEVVSLHVSSRLDHLRVLMSRSHRQKEEDEALARHKDKIESVAVKGAALKFCEIAEGKAELSWRYSPGTKEWDTAPGALLVEEAGGFFLKPDKSSYIQNREDVYNREGYIVGNSLDNFLL